jgi:hypothetical protein
VILARPRCRKGTTEADHQKAPSCCGDQVNRPEANATAADQIEMSGSVPAICLNVHGAVLLAYQRPLRKIDPQRVSTYPCRRTAPGSYFWAEISRPTLAWNGLRPPLLTPWRSAAVWTQPQAPSHIPPPSRPGRSPRPGRSFRMPDELTDRIDTWSADQSDQPSRTEAIRRLVEIGLKAKSAR